MRSVARPNGGFWGLLWPIGCAPLTASDLGEAMLDCDAYDGEWQEMYW